MNKYIVGLFQKEFNLLLVALGIAAANTKISPEMQRAIEELSQTIATNSEVLRDKDGNTGHGEGRTGDGANIRPEEDDIDL